MFITYKKRRLTDWHLDNLKVFVVHTINITEAEREAEFLDESMAKRKQKNYIWKHFISKFWAK